jgi:hypothetical protein
MKCKMLIFMILFVVGTGGVLAKQDTYQMTSPDKNIEIFVTTDSLIHFSVKFKEGELFSLSEIGMQLENEHLGENPVVVKSEKHHVDEKITPVVKIKEAEIIIKEFSQYL